MATASNSGSYSLNQQLANIQNSSAYQQWAVAQQKQSSTYIQQAAQAQISELAQLKWSKDIKWNVTSGSGLAYTTTYNLTYYDINSVTEEEKQVDRIYRELKKLATGRVKKPPKQLRIFFKQLQSA